MMKKDDYFNVIQANSKSKSNNKRKSEGELSEKRIESNLNVDLQIVSPHKNSPRMLHHYYPNSPRMLLN